MEFKSVRSFRVKFASVLLLGVTAGAQAQIPDLLTAFESTGRSLGMASSINATSSNPASAINNPAGLGYANRAAFSVTMRNLNESESRWSRNFVNPDVSTDGKSGKRSITQVGLIKPLGNNSAIGINYSVAGFVKDRATGTGLIDGGTILNNFSRDLRMKTDMFAISWGKSTNNYRQSFGVGLVVAQNNTRFQQAYQLFDNNGTPNDPNDDVFILNESDAASGNQTGFGLVAGLQFNPSADMSYGFSVRSPIALNGGNDVADFYKRIPGKASFGIAKRLENPRREDDFILLGGQADWYFAGSDDGIVPRDGSQIGFGIGAEYNYRFNAAYIPFRMGFRSIGSGGDGFGSANSFTFGLGYNPDRQNFGLDLDFGTNSRGGMDMSFMLSYRFN